MIDPMKHLDERCWSHFVGMTVFYQQPHMKSPEYGIITSIQSMPIYIHVRFMSDTTSKACDPKDLHWPPDFCAQDRCNVPEQIFNQELKHVNAGSH